MSGISSNIEITKKNKKRNKLKKSEIPKVKSCKSKYRFRKSAKSEDNLLSRKGNSKISNNNETDSESKLENQILEQTKDLSLRTEDEQNHPQTSNTVTENEHLHNLNETSIAGSSFDYNAELYYPKKTKSIKFTNQVTVLQFNRNNELCESMEPIKREEEQQLRNKEMRQDHLVKMGHKVNNVCLF